MKKNENYDFSVATRQSYVAILIIMYRLYKVIIRQLIPVFIIILLKGSLPKSPWFIYGIIVVALVAGLFSIVAFFKYYFYIKDNKLIVEKGVFKKSILEIPFDRIQSINTEQNLIHRVFKVVKLNMDTAGSAGNELQLFALDMDLAKQLNTKILKEKKESQVLDQTEEQVESSEKKIIFHLTIPQLLKVGVTENHIRSGGILLFFFFYIFDSLEDVGIDLLDKSEEYLPAAQELVQSLIVVLVLIVLFAIVAFVISLVRTVLKFYNLTMYRKGEGFIIVSGLLNKKERAAKDDKIQLVKWSQNLLQRLSGIYEILMKQASSQEVGEQKSFKVVGLSESNVFDTQAYVFKERYPELYKLPMNGINRYYFIRRLFIWSYLFIPILIVLGVLGKWIISIYIFTLYGLALWGSYLSFKKKKYGVGNEMLRIDGGTFGRKSTAMPLFKVQNISLTETPFQRRRKLSSLIIYTASGEMKIPEIRRNKAIEILNYLNYKVEVQKEKWM
jgi:putative membrane protein